VFSLSFQGVDGPKWVEHLLSGLPGGQVGFLIVVNLLIFVLAFFLDFFELSFIVVPLLGPVAIKLGIDPVWFGVLLAVNMQTSFMHPPFGFALFYLRSVAPTEDYQDRLTGRRIGKVTTGQIYWGAVPFVIIQIIMVALIIAFPGIVTRDTNKAAEGNIDMLQQQIDSGRKDEAAKPEPQMPGAEPKKEEAEDPMEAIRRANEADKQKK
jgi:TRAP-type mannitol/chloroaromatic compound transport system permease large subunit